MTQLKRRQILSAAAGSLALTALPSRAQAYPSRTITLVVPYAPGGATDVSARMLAQRMTEILGQTVIVENKPGAGGNVGTAAVARSTPDGYTLVTGTNNTLAANISVFSKMPFDPVKDLTPVGMIYFAPSMVVVNPKFPATTMAELIALLKKNPNEYAFGSPGIGASSHFAAELLNLSLGVKMTSIPYKGDTPALTDCIGGVVPIVFCNMPSGIKFVRGGQLRALAVTSAKRSPAFPDIPAIAEFGLPNFDISAWFNVMAPAGTPPEIVARLNSAMNTALQHPQLRGSLTELGGFVNPMTPDEVSTFIKSEIVKWGRIAKAANIKIDE